MGKMRKVGILLISLLSVFPLCLTSCKESTETDFSGFVRLEGVTDGALCPAGLTAELEDGKVCFRVVEGEYWEESPLCLWDGEQVEILREDFNGLFLTPVDGKVYYSVPYSTEIRWFDPETGEDGLFAEYAERMDRMDSLDDEHIDDLASAMQDAIELDGTESLSVDQLWSDGEQLYSLGQTTVGVFSLDGTLEKEVPLPENAFFSDYNIVSVAGVSGNRLLYYVREDGVYTPWVFDLSSEKSRALVVDTEASYWIFGERDGQLLAQREANGSGVLLDGGVHEEGLSVDGGGFLAGNDSVLWQKRSDCLYFIKEDGEEVRFAYTDIHRPALIGDTLYFTAWGDAARLDNTKTELQTFCTSSEEDNRFVYAASPDGTLSLLYSGRA